MPQTGLTISFIITKLIEAEQYLSELIAEENFNVENNIDPNDELNCHIFELFHIIQSLKGRVSRNILDDTTINLYYKLERSVGVGTSTDIIFDPYYVMMFSESISTSTDLSLYALDSTVVHNMTNETIDGVKTFLQSPIVPTATLGSQAVNLDQLNALSLGYTFSNGINLSGDDVKLGGLLTQPTGINLNTNDFFFLGEGNTSYEFTPSYLGLHVNPNSNTLSEFLLTPSQTYWNLTIDNKVNAIIFNGNSGMFVTDSFLNKGLQYTSNYSGNFTARSLIDKGYADSTYAPASGGGYVTTVNGTLNRITSTGGTTPIIDISSTFENLLAKVANPLSQFASTTSSQLSSVISDETGSGSLVFSNSPTLITPSLGTPSVLIGTNITGIASNLTAGSVTNGVYTTTLNALGDARWQLILGGTGIVKSTAGTISYLTDNSTNWNTAFSQTRQWDGDSTGLVAATGRTSLGLGTLATQSGTFSGTSSGTNTGDQTITLTSEASGSGTGSFAVTLANSAVIGKVLTGYVSGAGTVVATDSILQAVQKLNGNVGALVTGVSSFNTRTGAITLTSGDVTTALGFTPPANNTTMYIGTTAHALNRASASEALTGITSIDGSAAKWTTGRTLSITGDIAYTSPSFDGSGNVTAAGVLTTVNSNVGTFGGATSVGSFTVNAKGLITAANSTSIQITESQVTNLVSDLAAKTPLTNLAGTTGYIQKSTGTGTIGNSLSYDDGTYGYFGYNPASPLSYLTFGTPSITSALIKFTGTPDSVGAQHAQIVMDRDYPNYSYGSSLRFYTEAKNTANFTDTSRDVGGFNSLGNFDVLGTFYSGGKATIEGGTISFPFLQGGTYLGYQAGNSSIPNSTYNTFVGYQVGHTTTTGYNNTGVGLQTLSTVTSGYANTGIGLQTLLAATTAQFNFAGSIHALYSLIDGVANNAIGAGSLEYNLHGGGNNALGMYAGRSYMGNGSLFLGHQAGGLDSSSLDNQLYIANNQTTPLIYGIFDPNPYVRILGAFQTDGIDTYNSDLSLSYTSRTKIDKGYADGRYSLLAGGSSLTTVGTVTSGIWHGTPIADSYIASSSIWTNKIDMNNGIYTGYLTGPGGTLVNWTGGGVNNAIYSTTVTPSNSNYTLFHNGTYSTLSASTQTSLGINGSAILAVTSAGASISGSVTASQFKLSALNTAPSSSTDTGALGEIRITSTYIYTCIATNTWVRSALTTF